MNQPFVSVRNLRKYFEVKGRGMLHAVDDISFSIEKGSTLGLVGESGCGKSTTGRVMLRLISPTGGEVYFEGQNIFAIEGKRLKLMRRKMQMIFQDPYSSLDPRKTVHQIIAEPLFIHKTLRGKALAKKIDELAEMTGITPDMMDKFPHELDGGRRQRAGLTRALALDPDFIVCDEPVSALDVSIQAQIINLLQDLQEKLDLTYLFISHDLSVVRHISHKVMVMYLGRIVEEAETEELFENPLHPYTKALLSAVPIPKVGHRRERIILRGDVPSPVNPPPGCRFAGRCWQVQEICREKEPALLSINSHHRIACHLVKSEQVASSEL